MFCSNCGKSIENQAKFCGNCGTKVKVKQEIFHATSADNESSVSSKPSSKPLVWLLVVIGIVIAIAISAGNFGSTAQSSTQTSNEASEPETPAVSDQLVVDCTAYNIYLEKSWYNKPIYFLLNQLNIMSFEAPVASSPEMLDLYSKFASQGIPNTLYDSEKTPENKAIVESAITQIYSLCLSKAGIDLPVNY